VNHPPFRARTLTLAALLVVAGCAAKKDHPSAAAPAEPSADPSARVNVYTAARPDRGRGPDLGKGDAPSLVQPVNDCESAVCIGSASDALIEAVRSRAAQARSCYEKSLGKTPTLAGRMLLNLRIAHDGASCPFGLAQNELADSPTLVPCLRTLLETRYPRPTGGCVELNLPLRFVPEYVDAGAPGG
jgi:hypothetical protein